MFLCFTQFNKSLSASFSCAKKASNGAVEESVLEQLLLELVLRKEMKRVQFVDAKMDNAMTKALSRNEIDAHYSLIL